MKHRFFIQTACLAAAFILALSACAQTIQTSGSDTPHVDTSEPASDTQNGTEEGYEKSGREEPISCAYEIDTKQDEFTRVIREALKKTEPDAWSLTFFRDGRPSDSYVMSELNENHQRSFLALMESFQVLNVLPEKVPDETETSLFMRGSRAYIDKDVTFRAYKGCDFVYAEGAIGSGYVLLKPEGADVGSDYEYLRSWLEMAEEQRLLNAIQIRWPLQEPENALKAWSVQYEKGILSLDPEICSHMASSWCSVETYQMEELPETLKTEDEVCAYRIYYRITRVPANEPFVCIGGEHPYTGEDPNVPEGAVSTDGISCFAFHRDGYWYERTYEVDNGIPAGWSSYGFQTGSENGTLDMKTLASLPEGVLKTLSGYFDFYQQEKSTEDQTFAAASLVEEWKERYAILDEDSAFAIHDGYDKSQRTIEGFPYISDDLCFIFTVGNRFKHCIRMEKLNGDWYITDDAGTPYRNAPYGYDPALKPGRNDSVNLETAYYVKTEKLMEEAYRLILEKEENRLSKDDIMPAVAAVKDGLISNLGLRSATVFHSSDIEKQARECFTVEFAEEESTKMRVIDVLIAGKCLPETVPLLWAKVTEIPGHPPVSYTDSRVPDQKAYVHETPLPYFLVCKFSDPDAGNAFTASCDSEYGYYRKDGKSQWENRVFNYDFHGTDTGGEDAVFN